MVYPSYLSMLFFEGLSVFFSGAQSTTATEDIYTIYVYIYVCTDVRVRRRVRLPGRGIAGGIAGGITEGRE